MWMRSIARQRAAQEEAKRMAALGFKALRTSPYFSHGDTSIGLTATAVVTRWNFDSHGDGWKYLDAEKGRKFVTATVTVRSKSQDPLLFGIGAYVANGAVLTYVGRMRYRFVRWRDYGSFLGTQADFRNDFGYTSRIPFSVGVSVTDEELKRRPLYLVATREGCHRRLYERFGQPPIQYVPEQLLLAQADADHRRFQGRLAGGDQAARLSRAVIAGLTRIAAMDAGSGPA